MNFDWNELAFGSKKPIDSLKPIFIMAPREISMARLTQLIKTYLPQGNIVVGIAKEEYVAGFENQPQFKMLRLSAIEAFVKKINAAKLKYSVATLSYFQRDTKFVLEKLASTKVLAINGSWKYLFHTLAPYYVLATKQIPYEMLSPFADKQEARIFETNTTLSAIPKTGTFSADEMLRIADDAAAHSFDNGFQTGVAIGRKKGKKYELLTTGFNKVVPYQTYAWHNGASREANFSPMHDLNHYDTIHAEVDVMIHAQKQKIDLHDTTLFINLLPCPSCARMFTQTDITEFIYVNDHSEGYALKMLELAGKKVTRMVR